MSNAIRVKNKVKENLENNERSHKREHRLADGHKNEAQNPWKNLEGRPICSLYKKS